jgi:hypothetical protein
VSGTDDEFEDFLRRRKPVFRAPDDLFEPPAEIDRIVLRKAREAIEVAPPMRMFQGSRWAAPLALAATLVLALTVMFQVSEPQKRERVAEVTVQNTAQRVDYPVAPIAPTAIAPMADVDDRAGAASESSEAVVQLSKSTSARGEVAPTLPAEADRYSAPPPAALARSAGDSMSRESRMDVGGAASPTSSVPAAPAAIVPDWRRNSQTWLAEIDRLRNAGDTAQANAELEEYKRQHRALAVAPDR